MDDDQILMRGGTEEDIAQYARCNGADLTPADTKNTKLKEHSTSAAAPLLGGNIKAPNQPKKKDP